MNPAPFATRCVALAGLFLLATSLSAASLERAAELREEGRVEEARAELGALLAGGATGAEAAGALDLLAALAVDVGDHEAARGLLSRLIEEHPESAEAADAATKLKLLEALLGPAAEAVEPTPSAPGPAPPPGSPAPPSRSPVQPPAPASPGSAPPATTAKRAGPDAAGSEAPTASAPPPGAAPAGSTAAPGAGSASPALAAAAPPAESPTSLVLLAGRGNPYDAALDAVGRLTELLRGRGVEVENATGGIAVVEDSRFVQGQLLEAARQRRARSLLFFTLSTARQEVMLVECYEPGGALLWKERVTGGTGWTGRPYSASGLNENLFQRLTRKLERRVGKPGLPVGG